MVMVMVTVTPLQDPAGLVDDCPKLTNLHRYVDNEIENYAVNDDDDGDHDNVDDDDDDDNDDDDEEQPDQDDENDWG